jgi:hypothetical protein
MLPRWPCLDTSILIATDVTPIPGELAISMASLAELQFGVLIAKPPRRGRSVGPAERHPTSI